MPTFSASSRSNPFDKIMKAAGATQKGFTLLELMVVVAIVGVLAATAALSYRHFTQKTQSVEAEVALAEVHRLQQLYHAQHGAYGTDLGAIGFNQFPALKFYAIGMRVLGGTDGVSYQVLAYAKGPAEGSTSFVMTQYQDGRLTVEKSLVSVAGSSSGTVDGWAGGGPGSSASAPSAGGGETDADPLSSSNTGSSAPSGGGQRTVTHVIQSAGMGSK